MFLINTNKTHTSITEVLFGVPNMFIVYESLTYGGGRGKGNAVTCILHTKYAGVALKLKSLFKMSRFGLKEISYGMFFCIT